ncbi:hypothetical protein N9X12_04700 [Alphaproteobacteria bacterium]|nr:hypothetical protein [Alphaproteobacteria bacterium]
MSDIVLTIAGSDSGGGAIIQAQMALSVGLSFSPSPLCQLKRYCTSPMRMAHFRIFICCQQNSHAWQAAQKIYTNLNDKIALVTTN